MWQHSLDLPDAECSATVVITPRSHLLDQHVAECEIVSLPSRMIRGGTLSFSLGSGAASAPRPPKQASLPRKLKHALKTRTKNMGDTIILDVRRRSPQNWAHFLTNHLPIVFALCEAADLDWSDVTLILPKTTPGYILEAAAMFGFTTECTNATLNGMVLEFDADPWTGIRSVRAEWARMPSVEKALRAADIYDQEKLKALPSRVFISRRGTRTLENEQAVAEYLAHRGFQKLYIEDLSIPDQFRVFEAASHIVAIHGAGFAPLLYRSRQAAPCHVVELIPCGIATNVFRVITDLVGGRWIGVRGKIKPDYIKGIYDLENSFLSAVNDSFEIDTASLDHAFERFEFG